MRKVVQREAKALQSEYVGYLMRSLEANSIAYMDMRTFRDLFRSEEQGPCGPDSHEESSSAYGGQDTLGAEPMDLLQVLSRSPLRRMPQHTELDEVDDVPLYTSTVTAAAGVQRDTESEEMPNVPHPVTGKIKGWPWYNKYVATGPLRAATPRKPRKQKTDPSTDVCTNVNRFVKGRSSRSPPGTPRTAADLQKRKELREQAGDELRKQGGEESPAESGKETKGRLTTSADTSRDELQKQGGEQLPAVSGKEALELQSHASRVKELSDTVKRLEEKIADNTKKLSDFNESQQELRSASAKEFQAVQSMHKELKNDCDRVREKQRREFQSVTSKLGGIQGKVATLQECLPLLAWNQDIAVLKVAFEILMPDLQVVDEIETTQEIWPDCDDSIAVPSGARGIVMEIGDDDDGCVYGILVHFTSHYGELPDEWFGLDNIAKLKGMSLKAKLDSLEERVTYLE